MAKRSTDEEMLLEVRELFQADVDADRENRDAGVEDLKFIAGENQWDEQALQARSGRPCLIINRLPQFIAQVVGDIRINRPSIRVRPAEDADKDLADIREGLIRAIERQSDAQSVYANAATNQIGCGIGNFRVALDYADGDVFERDIFLRRIPDAFAVVWDSMSTDPTGRDARHCFVVEEMARDAFEKAYGAEMEGGLEVPIDQEWSTRDFVRVVEYWRIKETEVELALLEGGQVVEAAKLPPGVVPVQVRKRMRKSVCMTLMTGFGPLEKTVEWPISRLPIIRVPGWELTIGARRARWGMVRFAKDAQRLKNYWRSVAAEVLALAPRAQWLVNTSQQGMEPDSVDDFRNSAKSGDPVLEWEGSVPPERVDPPPVPGALLQEAQLCDQDMKDVTGIHDASLGARSNETSGRAIMARQREGDVANFIYQDNLKSAIAEAGKVINELIPVVYDTARTIRVVGEDEGTKVQRINDPSNPDSIDINKGKYDIAVDVGPSYSTRRVEAAESMMQFVQAFPAAAEVAGDLIARSQDWPMADDIADRLKKALPPGMVQEEPKSEEEAQALQAQAMQAQQQQQMQQQAAQLELAEKEAKVIKLHAEARAVGAPTQQGDTPLDEAIKVAQLHKAQADADKAFYEAERAAVALKADQMNLAKVPIETAQAAANLKNTINPPDEQAA